MSLQKIQERLKAPKSQFNSFGKYTYRNVEDIQEAVKPLLAEYKMSLIISDDVVAISDRVYIKSTAKLMDEAGKVVVENTAFAREPDSKKGMDLAQLSGATSSYSRKYCLGGMFLLDDTKDADSGKPPESPNPPPIKPIPKPAPKKTPPNHRTDDQHEKILILGSERTLTKKDIGAMVQWKTGGQNLTMALADEIIKNFDAVCAAYTEAMVKALPQ